LQSEVYRLADEFAVRDRSADGLPQVIEVSSSGLEREVLEIAVDEFRLFLLNPNGCTEVGSHIRDCATGVR
jgi:hypothetical protein